MPPHYFDASYPSESNMLRWKISLFLAWVFPFAGGPQVNTGAPRVDGHTSDDPFFLPELLGWHRIATIHKDWRMLSTSLHGSPALLDSCGAGSLIKSTTMHEKQRSMLDQELNACVYLSLRSKTWVCPQFHLVAAKKAQDAPEPCHVGAH